MWPFVKHDNPSLLPNGLPLLPVLVFLRFTRDANNVGKVNLKIYVAVNLEVKLDLHSEPPPLHLLGFKPLGYTVIDTAVHVLTPNAPKKRRPPVLPTPRHQVGKLSINFNRSCPSATVP